MQQQTLQIPRISIQMVRSLLQTHDTEVMNDNFPIRNYFNIVKLCSHYTGQQPDLTTADALYHAYLRARKEGDQIKIVKYVHQLKTEKQKHYNVISTFLEATKDVQLTAESRPELYDDKSVGVLSHEIEN